MQSQIPGLVLFMIVASVANTEDVKPSPIEVNYRLCEKDLDINTTVYSEDLQVYVTGCETFNKTGARCPLKKGEDPILTILFKATRSVPDLERLIIAKVPVQLTDSRIEMPYGPAVSPCVNSSMVDREQGGCVEQGVVKDKHYTYVSTFRVMPSFPSVNNIETKFIVRKSLPKFKKLRKYRLHPGPVVLCFIIPNIDVVD